MTFTNVLIRNRVLFSKNQLVLVGSWVLRAGDSVSSQCHVTDGWAAKHSRKHVYVWVWKVWLMMSPLGWLACCCCSVLFEEHQSYFIFWFAFISLSRVWGVDSAQAQSATAKKNFTDVTVGKFNNLSLIQHIVINTISYYSSYKHKFCLFIFPQ